MKIFLIGLAIIFSLGFISAGLGLITLPGHVASNSVQTAHDVVDKTINVNNALFNYEEFFNKYEGVKMEVINIKNTEKSIQTLKDTYGEDATKWPKDVRGDYSNLQQNIEGYKMMYQKIVQEYNADSQKLNRNLFKSKSLPYMLPDDYKLID